MKSADKSDDIRALLQGMQAMRVRAVRAEIDKARPAWRSFSYGVEVTDGRPNAFVVRPAYRGIKRRVLRRKHLRRAGTRVGTACGWFGIPNVTSNDRDVTCRAQRKRAAK